METENQLPIIGWQPLTPPDRLSTAPDDNNNEAFMMQIVNRLHTLPTATIDQFDLSRFHINVTHQTTYQDQLLAMTSIIKDIIETSTAPTEIFQAHQRNIQCAARGSLEINEGDFFHGFPIAYLTEMRRGIFSGDLYSDTDNRVKGNVYLSEIHGAYNPQQETLDQLIQKTVTKTYGTGSGKATVLLRQDCSSAKHVPNKQFGGSTERSISKALPIGAYATDLAACIADTDNDLQIAKTSLSEYQFFVPLYDGRTNKLVFTHQDWLTTHPSK